MPQPFHPPHGDLSPHPSATMRATTLLLMVGLPGAGKTTRAKELALAHRALRLTPDEWMISLFDGAQPEGKRDLLEGLLISVARQALRLGTSVVLDFGLWSRDERSALRWLARSAGASCQVIYLPVDEDLQRARIAHRQATAPRADVPDERRRHRQLAGAVRGTRCRRIRRQPDPRAADRVGGLAGVGRGPLALTGSWLAPLAWARFFPPAPHATRRPATPARHTAPSPGQPPRCDVAVARTTAMPHRRGRRHGPGGPSRYRTPRRNQPPQAWGQPTAQAGGGNRAIRRSSIRGSCVSASRRPGLGPNRSTVSG